MSDDIAVEVTETEQPKKKLGRPPGTGKKILETRVVTRETRVPLGGFSGPLTLQNKDPNYFYYWPLDASEGGPEIERLIQAGYVFCTPEENLVPGNTSVYSTTTGVGSIIRVPAGNDNKYHYLMKIPLEWHKDDQKRHFDRVDKTEEALYAPIDGLHGEGLKIG